MRLPSLIALASCFALSSAHIFGISGPSTYTPKAHSKYPLTFKTANGPITNDDLSVAIGLQFASGAFPPPALGVFIQNFDLQGEGHGNTGNGEFTLEVSLPKSSFFNGPGKYVISTVVTNGVGAAFNIQLLFFNLTTDVQGV